MIKCVLVWGVSVLACGKTIRKKSVLKKYIRCCAPNRSHREMLFLSWTYISHWCFTEGEADCPRKEKQDQKASNGIADWKSAIKEGTCFFVSFLRNNLVGFQEPSLLRKNAVPRFKKM